MRELSEAEQEVVDILDKQIAKIDRKLEPFSALIEQKQRLVKTKAALLNERITNNSRANASLTHEQVTQAYRTAGKKALTVARIAELTGVAPATVRSHLHRNKDQRYEQLENKKWRLIGDDDTDTDD